MEINYISEEEKNTIEFLRSIDQSHLVSNISSFSVSERCEFINQVNYLNKSYPGGLKTYIERAKKLLADSANDVNPYEGYEPLVPKGETVSFYEQPHFDELEQIGMNEMKNACFVLLGGGLGERLGYSSIKPSIPFELLTEKSFLQYYIEYILAFQHKCDAKTPLPFAIMVSDDTNDLTIKLLEENNYFGMPKSQLTIMRQEKVPAMINNLGHFAQRTNSLLIDTKPHGHGDVHTLLYMTGIAKKWHEEGRKWICLFQDTNPLIFRSYPAALGVSKKNNFEMNSITVPRKPGEAVGAICNLRNQKDGKNLTINVEYNQLDSLLKTYGGEKVDKDGYSIYPGNINGLIFSIPDYIPILYETQGLIAEFINPKYTDNTKTTFKSPTRLECMMQDYPKLLKSGERVGFIQIDRRFCFSTVKNDIKTASQKFKSNMPPESASICEQEFYWLNSEILRLCGIDFENEENPKIGSYAGIEIPEKTRVVLHPEFGVTLKEIRERIKGKNLICKRSNVIFEKPIQIENFVLDGSFVAKNDLINVKEMNEKRLEYIGIDLENKELPEYLKIRGYRLNSKI